MGMDARRERLYRIGYFALSFLLVFLIAFSALFGIEREIRKSRIEELKRQEQRVTHLVSDYLGREFAVILSDLHYLHHANKKDLLDPDHYADIAANWTVFSTQRKIYDQIRYLDIHGDEKIRIDIGENGGFIVPESELQNKADRYYFTETIKLGEEGIYVSPLDLNIENGAIELPHKPMIRISTPVFDASGTMQGIIILNYLAETMLSEFRKQAVNSEGEILLLNANGYVLSSPDAEDEWNFMFEDRKEDTFGRDYPDEWQSIRDKDEQFTTERGLFTAASVLLDRKFTGEEGDGHDHELVFGGDDWHVVSLYARTPENSAFFDDKLGVLMVDVFRKNVIDFLLIGIVSVLVAVLVYLNRRTYDRIKFFSEHDPLTKTWNRRAGIARLNELFPLDDRRQFLVSICFIDINGLKTVNDTLGHKFGDELILSVSQVIKETIREKDLLIRLGGDEFLIVFAGIGVDKAETVWSRIVHRYEQINELENRPYLISVSHGIVAYDNQQRTLMDDRISAADEKMYLEKQQMKIGLNVIRGKAQT
jgi:diguanylate cyclase (GGDEF)-like protein